MSLEYTNEESDRFKKWFALSHKVGVLGSEFLTQYIQDVGRIDIDLMRRDKYILEELESLDGYTPHIQESQALARLWVLGVYEILRIIKNNELESAEIRSLYEVFRRIRVPLAKLEAAAGYDTDRDFALMIILREKGIAWSTNGKYIISRQELSDKLLTILDSI